MARCLRPLTIKRPGFADSPHNLPRYGRENLRPYLYDTVVVPCGKCLACLKNKQSSMVVRCKREAEKRGTFAFMTLTYDDDHLPLTRSLYRINIDTGEEELYYKPDFISTGFHPNEDYLKVFSQMQPSECPRSLDLDWFQDSQYVYQIRVTPSVCRLDVRTWLKTARIQYERDNGEKLPNFSYVAISEYGPRTCRPHYHLAFFGLRKKHLNWLLERWTFGTVKQVKMVMQINKDGSSGFLRASRYIGKYMSKGKFECPSVKDKSAERPRVCQSIGLGSDNIEPIKRQVCCFDMYGEYDLDTLRFIDTQKPLTGLQIQALIAEIPKRLSYKVSPEVKDVSGRVIKKACYLPIPRVIRDKIFKVSGLYEDKTKKVSTTIWRMVTDALRADVDRNGDEQFIEFCSLHPEREIAENCAEFAVYQEFCSGVQEAVMQEDYKSFYSKSHF